MRQGQLQPPPTPSPHAGKWASMTARATCLGRVPLGVYIGTCLNGLAQMQAVSSRLPVQGQLVLSSVMAHSTDSQSTTH